MFEGDTADPRTLATQIDKIKRRFALKHVVLVGNRGKITQARLDAEIAPAGLDWITANSPLTTDSVPGRAFIGTWPKPRRYTA
jgi:hypothetical protein